MKRICLLMILFAGFLANQAWAFSLSPASLELEIKRGESQPQTLNVNNDSEKSVLCQMAVTGFEVSPDGKQRFEDATPDYSAISWIEIEETAFNITPKSSKKAGIVITVPKNAKPGDYFACIFGQIQTPGKAITSQGQEVVITVNFQLGCIIRITVPGRAIPKKALVSDVRVEMPSAENKDEGVKIIGTLVNKCALHLDAMGEVMIKNSGNRTFEKLILQGAGKNTKGEALVYPMSSREFFGVIQKPLPPGNYTAEVVFSYGYRSQKAKAQAKFTVSQEIGKQKELLALTIEPSVIELEMTHNTFRVRRVDVFNRDSEEKLVIKAGSQTPWVTVDPTEFTINPNKDRSLRIMISTIDNEPVARAGKITLTPERGKSVTLDVIVSEEKEKEDK